MIKFGDEIILSRLITAHKNFSKFDLNAKTLFSVPKIFRSGKNPKTLFSKHKIFRYEKLS